MIEKLDPLRDNFLTMVKKHNALVDAVNKLETMAKNTNTVLKSLVQENNIHEKHIDELQMKVEPEECEIPAENVQKEQITLLDIFNEMGEMYSSLWNKMEDIHHELKTKGGNNE